MASETVDALENPPNVIRVKKPGKRYFYVSEEKRKAEKWWCNGIRSYVSSTDGEDFQVPTKKERVICGCDQPDDCSWEGCSGYTKQIIEAQEYDERFFSMLKSLFTNQNHEEILGNNLYAEILGSIKYAKEKREARETPKIELNNREAFWYSKKVYWEDEHSTHAIKNSTITKNLGGIESREYTSYCSKDIFSWYYEGDAILNFGTLGEANSRGISSCKKCLEGLALTLGTSD